LVYNLFPNISTHIIEYYLKKIITYLLLNISIISRDKMFVKKSFNFNRTFRYSSIKNSVDFVVLRNVFVVRNFRGICRDF